MGINRTGKKIQYRYRMEIPRLDYEDDGFVSVFCPVDCCDWSKLTWGRFGSGGVYFARHLFVDDWRIEHLWRRLGQGLAKALIHGVMTAPDFTIDDHFPLPVAQYQVFRSRVLTKYWQDHGVVVVPVLQWGNPSTYEICAKGIKPGSVVAVRGPQKGREKQWLAGAKYMHETISPELVLHFGRKIDCWDNAVFYPLRKTS